MVGGGGRGGGGGGGGGGGDDGGLNHPVHARRLRGRLDLGWPTSPWPPLLTIGLD